MGFFSRWRSKKPADQVWNRIARQDSYEAEGARMGLAGAKREDCPYDEHLQSEAWNFWVYGRDNAVGELLMIQNGYVDICSTGHEAPIIRLSLKDAVSRGFFTPKFAPLPPDLMKPTTIGSSS